MNNFDPTYRTKGIPDVLQGCSVEIIDLIKGGRHLVGLWKDLKEKETEEIKKFCRVHRLNFYISNFKFSAKERKRDKKVKMPLSSNAEGYRQIRIFDKSLKNRNVKNFSNKELAKAMDYPTCCIDNYLKKKKLNEVLKINKRFLKINYLNNFFPHFIANVGFCSTYIHTHIPCSPDCEKTKQRSKEILRNIKEYDRGYYHKIKYFCELPAIYLSDPKISKIKEDIPVVIFNGKYLKNKIFYDNLISNKPFFSLLKKANNLEFNGNKINLLSDDKFICTLEIKPKYDYHVIVPK